ncbi:type II secretion system protein [Pararobbsia alpina]|uniref:type II secretion system protein n=1 Tax=Pararobbsia alpina TaxID=621374 RepID=UPI0039A5C5BE
MQGFTYIGTLILLSMLAISASSLVLLGAAQRRREVEDQLLYVGDLYRIAIRDYFLATPPGQPHYPNSLEDLVLDPRYPMPKRYIRRVYPDPIAPNQSWQIVPAPEGGILGVRSSSALRPIKQANFPDLYRDFEHKDHYSDWVFTFLPVTASPVQQK